MILAPYGHVPGAFPYEIGYAYGPAGPNDYLCPKDPQWNTKGEQGFYYDTSLGHVTQKPGLFTRIKNKIAARRAARASGFAGIPTDAELASVYGFTPVMSGWIATDQGYVTGPLMPNGWRAAGAFGPPTSLNGLRDAAIEQVAPTRAEDVLAAMNAHNERIFTLTMVSTIVGGVAATLAIVRTIKSLREE